MTGQPDTAEREVREQASGTATAYAERFGSAFSWGQPVPAEPANEQPEAEALDHRIRLAVELAAYDRYRSKKTKASA